MKDTPAAPPEPIDVLIVGAGISGIDAARHLRHMRPDTRFEIVEAHDDIGGTWLTHRFPGIRSDSDLFTFGFKWKPWKGTPIATADEILDYLTEAVAEEDLRRHIRFGTRVVAARWNSGDACWTVELSSAKGPRRVQCRFLWMCSGYYRHSQGYMPEFPGKDSFAGPVVHPQHWPEDLDHTGKRVVVIGSGATAATLIPALARTAGHVTMLQRSPTYYFPRPQTDEFTQILSQLGLPDDQFHDIMRRRYLYEARKMRARSLSEPDILADEMIAATRAYLGDDFDVGTHFTPSYRPWQQRVAVVPDGDLFRAIASGTASVATGHIDRFEPGGIRLRDGTTIAADIIVSATGLTLNALGDVEVSIDGAPLEIGERFTHHGIMFNDVPNLFNVFGYIRSSWTLRADLVSDYVCRLLAHMDGRGARTVTPVLRGADARMTPRPWIEAENFSSGYFQRSLDILPKQGDRAPWVMSHDYFIDREVLPRADLDDGTLAYG
ncbi:MAG: NAD(P)/FAD-dependent oxidoreductase [Rhodobacteraceae bacterium]|nr:NAD(P)/FAD-dependent oxidoreductase [Paracoccaceae bacterium]